MNQFDEPEGQVEGKIQDTEQAEEEIDANSVKYWRALAEKLRTQLNFEQIDTARQLQAKNKQIKEKDDTIKELVLRNHKDNDNWQKREKALLEELAQLGEDAKKFDEEQHKITLKWNKYTQEAEDIRNALEKELKVSRNLNKTYKQQLEQAQDLVDELKSHNAHIRKTAGIYLFNNYIYMQFIKWEEDLDLEVIQKKYLLTNDIDGINELSCECNLIYKFLMKDNGRFSRFNDKLKIVMKQARILDTFLVVKRVTADNNDNVAFHAECWSPVHANNPIIFGDLLLHQHKIKETYQKLSKAQREPQQQNENECKQEEKLNKHKNNSTKKPAVSK